MRKESIVSHLFSIEPALEKILVSGKDETSNPDQPKYFPLAIRSMVRYCITTNHLKRLKQIAKFTPNNEHLVVFISNSGEAFINLSNFSVKVYWPRSKVFIEFKDFTSNKGMVGSEEYKAFNIPTMVDWSFLDENIYKHLWMICSNGLFGVYTPSVLDTDNFNYNKLAKILYSGNFGTTYTRSLRFNFHENYRATLSTLTKFKQAGEITIGVPYLYIEEVEELVENKWIPFDGWQQNVVLVYDLIEGMNKRVRGILKDHSKTLENATDFKEDPEWLKGFY